MPNLLIFDAFTLLMENSANYALLRCKTFSLKIWRCKIFDKYHVCPEAFFPSTVHWLWEGKRKKWQQCVLIWQNICLFWMIMKTWSGIEPCVLFWMQHWLVHWWHVKRRYSENYSLPSRERSTACTLLNCFQPHRNHPFHLKAWILWALNRRGQNEYRLEVVGLIWQMCETDSLRFIAFCCW